MKILRCWCSNPSGGKLFAINLLLTMKKYKVDKHCQLCVLQENSNGVVGGTPVSNKNAFRIPAYTGQGVSNQGGVCLGGVGPGGVCPGQIPLSDQRQIDTCENITFVCGR